MSPRKELRKRREAAGISLREMARRLKISAPFLSDMERGHRNLSEAWVVRIEQELAKVPAAK